MYTKQPTNQTKFFVVWEVYFFGKKQTYFFYHDTWESAHKQVSEKATRNAGEGEQTMVLHQYNRNWRIDRAPEPVLYAISITVDPVKHFPEETTYRYEPKSAL